MTDVDANAYLALCVQFENENKPHVCLPVADLKQLCLNYKPEKPDPTYLGMMGMP